MALGSHSGSLKKSGERLHDSLHEKHRRASRRPLSSRSFSAIRFVFISRSLFFLFFNFNHVSQHISVAADMFNFVKRTQNEDDEKRWAVCSRALLRIYRMKREQRK